MKLHLVLVAISFWSISANSARAQTIRKEIWGKWVVVRILPANTISCWDEIQAKALINTEIDYSPESFRRKNVVTKNPTATAKVITAEQFHQDNSGGASDSSQVTFEQLGIKSKKANEITIHPPPADITGGTIEIPGDEVLVKDKDTIIVSACNVYFEARRVSAAASARQQRRPGSR